MQPYQEATQEVMRQGTLPLKAAKSAIGAGTAAFLSGTAGRVLPFLSKYVPENLAIKGLSKIDPRLGNFIKTALAAGESFDQAKEFIGSKIEEEAESEEPSKQNRSLLKQYDPELHKYIELGMKKGMSLVEVGKKALGHERFKKSIDKLTKDHKTSWDSILRTVFGEGAAYEEQEGQPQSQPQQVAPQQQQPQQGGQGQQGNQGQQGLDPAVAQIMQQGYEILKARKGQQQ